MAEQNEDFLNGYAEIGAYLKMTDRQVENIAETVPDFPVFSIGRRRCALKSRLDSWLSDKAAQSSIEGKGND